MKPVITKVKHPEATVIWKKDMLFRAHIDQHSFAMDVPIENGGGDTAPSPKTLLMTSLAGCTAIDVVSLLKKMQIVFTQFQVYVTAKLAEDHPKIYTHMHLVYEFFGEGLLENKEQIEKAIKLSKEKYCGVGAMLEKSAKITYEIVLKENIDVSSI